MVNGKVLTVSLMSVRILTSSSMFSDIRVSNGDFTAGRFAEVSLLKFFTHRLSSGSSIAHTNRLLCEVLEIEDTIPSTSTLLKHTSHRLALRFMFMYM